MSEQGQNWQEYLKDRAVSIIVDALGTVNREAREQVIYGVFRHFCKHCGKKLNPADPADRVCHCTRKG